MRFHLPYLLAGIGLLVFPAVGAGAQVTAYHDRATFTAALTSPSFTDDFESYPLGDIALGDRRGDFLYYFDPNITQPAIVLGGNGGQALGGSPFDVFVGGDSVTLSYAPIDLSRGLLLRAVGVDILYAPSGLDIPP